MELSSLPSDLGTECDQMGAMKGRVTLVTREAEPKCSAFWEPLVEQNWELGWRCGNDS